MPRIYSKNVYDSVDIYFAGSNIPIRCQGQAYKIDKESDWKWDDMEWEYNQSDIMETADWVLNSLTEDERYQYGVDRLDEEELYEYITDWATREVEEEWEKQYHRKKEIDWQPRW